MTTRSTTTVIALAALSACSGRSDPTGPHPWQRTMTVDERRTWVTTCSGDAHVAVRAYAGIIAYESTNRTVTCALEWDPHRERIDVLSISILAAREDDLSSARVTRYAELVMSEMDERDRDAAIAMRAAADGDPVEVDTRAFGILGGKDLWLEGWHWSVRVKARSGEAPASSPETTRWFEAHTFRELPASTGMVVEIFSDDGVLRFVNLASTGMPPRLAYSLVHGWEDALESGRSTRSIQHGDARMAVSAGYRNAFRRADGSYQAELQWRASTRVPDDDGKLQRHRRFARGGPIVFTTPEPVTLHPRDWYQLPRNAAGRGDP